MSARSVGTPYKHFREADERFDVVVVGSGMGGLATAAFLSKIAGSRVLVLERHYTAGGFTHVFRRPGFEWDVGVHYVGEVHQPESDVARLFDYVAEGRVSWQPMPDAYDRIVIGDVPFDYVSGAARLKDAIVRAFPAERRAIDGYFAAVERQRRCAAWFYSDKALPSPVSRVVGPLFRHAFMKQARQTTGEVLARLGVSPMLRAVLTGQWGDYGAPPAVSSFAMHALTTSHYFEGASYPVGGASEIARSLLPTIERHGGAVVVDANVTRILVEGMRAVGVRLQDGREIRAPLVVSAAGFSGTLRLTPEWQAMVSRARTNGAPLVPPSPAHLCLYVGLELKPGTAPLQGTNYWIHPSADYERNWTSFTADLDAPFPLLFVSFPSAKDPSFESRYPGRQTIQISTLALYEHFAAWDGTRWKRRGCEYEALKEQLAERLIAELHRHVPATIGSIVTTELSTPLSTRHFANHAAGEIYGLAHTPDRFADLALRPRTPVTQLFLTGQDVGVCSVMGAFVSGAVTASAIMGRNLYLRLPRPATVRRAASATPEVRLERPRAVAGPSTGAIE